MKKILNYRPIVFFSVTLMTGIGLSFLLLNNIIAVGVISGVFALAATICVLRKRFLPVLLLAGFLCGFLGLFIHNKVNVKQFDNQYSEIEATIYKVYTVRDRHLIYGKDITVDGKKISGNVKFFAEKDDSHVLYTRMEMHGDISSVPPYSDINGYGSGVFYNADNVTVNKTYLSYNFIDKIRHRMTAPMDLFLNSKNKGVALSLVFGDTILMDASENTSARIAGVYHIYSVSGLHVSFLIAVVAFILTAMNVKNKYKLFFVLPFITIYIALSNFPPSGIRAAVMSTVYLGSHIVKKKMDPLTALSFACAAILIFAPNWMFSYSFLMSITAIAGITLFYKPIKNVANLNPGNKYHNYFSSAIALSLSSNVLLIPLTLVLFGQLSTYFIIANIIIVPLATFAFLLVIVVGILCLISPNFGVLYALCEMPIVALRYMTGLITLLPKAAVNAELEVITAVGIILVALLWSRYFLIKKETKFAITLVVAFGVFVSMAASYGANVI